MARNVFVAGGTSGVNFAIARAFAASGANVAVLSRTRAKVDSATEELRHLAPAARGHAADVRDYDAVHEAIAQTAREWGDLDVIVSGAAGNFVAPAEAISSRGFQSVVNIDLIGTFHVLRAAWEHLRKPGGVVLNISAPQSWLPVPGQAHVNASKAGIDQLTRTLALEWGPVGVRVNSLSPGPVEDTEGMRRLAPTEESVRVWTEAVPLRRFASSDEIAAAALWLCSASAAFVTGVVLPVDGGLALGGATAVAHGMHATNQL